MKAIMKNLIQNKNSHKFSADALLLASFTPLDKVEKFVELGTGCGIIALELLERKKSLSGLGIDCNKELLTSAKSNLELYTHGNSSIYNIEFIEEDLENCPNFKNNKILEFRNSCDLVVTNPPWLLENQGKVPIDEIKRKALFAKRDVYNLFFKNARYFLKEKGLLSFVSIPSRLGDIFEALAKNGFSPKFLQFVHNTTKSEAIFVLCLAEFKGKKANSLELQVLPAKYLH